MTNINKNLKLLIVITAFVFGLSINAPHAQAACCGQQNVTYSTGKNMTYSYTPNQVYSYDNYYPSVDNSYNQYQYGTYNPQPQNVYYNPQPYQNGYYNQQYQNTNQVTNTKDTTTTNTTTKKVATNTNTTKKAATTTKDTAVSCSTGLDATTGEYKNALGANALFASNGFLPTNFFQWLILFIIILAIVFLWRKIYVTDHERHAPLKHE